jgi:hypothetical protein
MLLRAYRGGNGSVAGGQEDSRTQGLGPERLDAFGAPNVINNHQGSFVPDYAPVPVDALEFGFLVSRLVSEHAPHLRLILLVSRAGLGPSRLPATH